MSKVIDFGLDPNNIVCFDTETTGLDGSAEICQLAIVNFDETVVFSKLIKPQEKISKEVSLIHGVTNEMVAYEKDIKYWWSFLNKQFFTSKLVLGYNVMYDIRMLFQSITRFEKNIYFSPFMVIDVMTLVSNLSADGKWMSLGSACKKYEIEEPDNLKYHNAEFDAIMTMRLFKKISQAQIDF